MYKRQDLNILQTELAFTIPLLIQFPKCYWIWGHRRWLLLEVIKRLPVPVARRVWEEELGLVAKMLTRDRRNFHAWGYRRLVVQMLESPTLHGTSMAEPEFQYTDGMIRVDLSNFSAWHGRSKLIPRLLDERNADDAARKAFFDTGKLRSPLLSFSVLFFCFVFLPYPKLVSYRTSAMNERKIELALIQKGGKSSVSSATR